MKTLGIVVAVMVGGCILLTIFVGVVGSIASRGSGDAASAAPKAASGSSAPTAAKQEHVGKKAEPAGDPKAEEKRFETCRAKLKKAQQLEMLYDLDWKSGKLPKVVVGRTFFTVPIDAKQGFADTVNCFLMTGKDKYISFTLLDWQTGKVVGEYKLGRLEMN